MRRPTVIVTADSGTLGQHPAFCLTQKYVTPVVDIMGCLPLLLPPLASRLDLDALLDLADGIILTGAHSNIEPHHYGQAPDDPASLRDPARDATTLPLLKGALARRIPLFAICRGFQETNVALGGTLHQSIHAVPGFNDHREDKQAPIEVQYGPAHPVRAVADGVLEHIVGCAEWQVNTVHGQGVAVLADQLVAEAHAPDGVIEAFSLASKRSYLIGVQWHPEWDAVNNPVSVRLYSAFADACRQYAHRRLESGADDEEG